MAETAPPSRQAEGSGDQLNVPQRPTGALQNTQSTSNAVPTATDEAPSLKKRRNHRGGRKKKNRRQSFAATSDAPGIGDGHDLRESPAPITARPTFYRLGQSGGRNLSETSLDSEALLDHRWATRLASKC